MADIAAITLPSGTTYNLKDATARSELSGKQATLVSGTNIKTVNGNSLLGSGDLTIGGGSAAAYVTAQGTTGSTWVYRKWSDGYQEAWYNGSVTFSTAGSATNGWLRAVQNVSLPTWPSGSGMAAFADTAVVQATGAYSGRVYTSGGIKTSGTQWEAQILGGNSGSISAGTYSGWSVYVAGFAR